MNPSSEHDFDFLVGDWRVLHRRLRERLAGCDAWEEFDGTCTMRTLLGGFEDGVGSFYADETFKGQAIRVRFRWSGIDSGSPVWEQAFSPDGGKTWEINWTMRFVRQS
jgi:hypothetical protein